MAFKASACPNCGGSLEIPDDKDSVLCPYCGSIVVIREGNQKKSEPNQSNYLNLAELALNELSKEILEFDDDNNWLDSDILKYCDKALEFDIHTPKAWYIKGFYYGLGHEYPEMRKNFQKSIDFSSNDTLKEEYRLKIIEAINKIVAKSSFERKNGWPYTFLGLETEFPEMEYALSLKPDNITTINNIIKLHEFFLSQVDKELSNKVQCGILNFLKLKINNIEYGSIIQKRLDGVRRYEKKLSELNHSYIDSQITKEFEKKYAGHLTTYTTYNRQTDSINNKVTTTAPKRSIWVIVLVGILLIGITVVAFQFFLTANDATHKPLSEILKDEYQPNNQFQFNITRINSSTLKVTYLGSDYANEVKAINWEYTYLTKSSKQSSTSNDIDVDMNDKVQQMGNRYSNLPLEVGSVIYIQVPGMFSERPTIVLEGTAYLFNDSTIVCYPSNGINMRG